MMPLVGTATVFASSVRWTRLATSAVPYDASIARQATTQMVSQVPHHAAFKKLDLRPALRRKASTSHLARC